MLMSDFIESTMEVDGGSKADKLVASDQGWKRGSEGGLPPRRRFPASGIHCGIERVQELEEQAKGPFIVEMYSSQC